MTKKQQQQADRDEAIAKLREWAPPGTTVYTVLDHVSSSGMSRAIRVVIPYTLEDGTIDHVHPNWAVGEVLGLRHWKRHGREQDALVVSGCGMDMGFHLVNSLSYALYGSGYACLGHGKCPSNYHVNHRSRLRCDGANSHRCYRPWGDDTPDGWPRLAPIDVGDGQTIPGPLAACEMADDWTPIGVCPACEGLGTVPNPDGPERFDLVHTDGYALRHRWL